MPQLLSSNVWFVLSNASGKNGDPKIRCIPVSDIYVTVSHRSTCLLNLVFLSITSSCWLPSLQREFLSSKHQHYNKTFWMWKRAIIFEQFICSSRLTVQRNVSKSKAISSRQYFSEWRSLRQKSTWQWCFHIRLSRFCFCKRDSTNAGHVASCNTENKDPAAAEPKKRIWRKRNSGFTCQSSTLSGTNRCSSKCKANWCSDMI